MDADTPPAWLERGADTDPRAAALIFEEGEVSYADLAYLVATRSKSLRGELGSAAAHEVAVRADLPSIVEILAAMRAGYAAVPYADRPHGCDARLAPETILCCATSGSTGEPRLVPLTGGNIAAAVRASRRRLGTGRGDTWLAVLPFDHIGGLSVLFRSLEAGGTAAVTTFGDATTRFLRQRAPTVASLVPTMVYRLLDRDPDALAAVGTVMVGGASLPATLHDRARRAGVRVVRTYGMTEAASQIATGIPGREPADEDAIGPPLPGMEVRIAGGEQVGRIEIDGEAVFVGYVGENERSGPFTTGDVGYLTSEGDLAVIGRADDVVVTGGLNVSLGRVRDRIAELPSVTDAIVVALPDPEWGVILGAVVEAATDVTVPAIVEAVSGWPPQERPKRWRLGRVPLLDNSKHDVATARRMLAE